MARQVKIDPELREQTFQRGIPDHLFLAANGEGPERQMAEHDPRRARIFHRPAQRLLDLCADGQTFGAFDALHDHPDPAAFAEAVGRMAAGAYGTAGPAFVEHLLLDLEGALAQVREAAEAFKVHAVKELGVSAEGQTQRALARFALIAAAGEMATGWGLTGWNAGEASRAALTGARLWLDGRGGAGPSEARQAIERTRVFIVAHGAARFEPLGDPSENWLRVHNRAGWRDGDLYYIAADTWANEVHAGADPKRAAQAVQEAGFLISDSNRLQTKAPRAAGRARCYCIDGRIIGGDDD